MTFAPLCLFANILNLFKFHNAIPTDLCFPTLNTSDCEVPPIPVFTYYKPGSRCEIELWRGCPTLNKFENEYECSHACIGSLSPSFSAENNEIEGEDGEESPECKEPINLDDCGMKEEEVYTYDAEQGKCEAVQWKGCETRNKFEDKDSCKETCKHLLKDDETGSKEEVDEEEEEEEEKHESEEKKSTEKEGSGEKEHSEEKKSGEAEEKKAHEHEKEEEGAEKLKAQSSDGDPEETASVRRFGSNQTVANATVHRPKVLTIL